MNLQKSIAIGLFLFLILAIVILFSWGRNNMSISKSSLTLSEFIEKGEYGGLSLTIYFFSPNSLSRAPISINDLTDSMYEYKITINGSSLVLQL